MQIMAKATFLGFVQSLAPQSRQVGIAGLNIALPNLEGVAVGDVLQLEASLDEAGAWSGLVVTHLASPHAATPARVGPAAEAPAPTPGPAPITAPANTPLAKGVPAPAAQPVRAPEAPPAEAPRTQAPARRFGISAGPSSSARTPAATQARTAQRPAFSPTAADAGITY